MVLFANLCAAQIAVKEMKLQQKLQRDKEEMERRAAAKKETIERRQNVGV